MSVRIAILGGGGVGVCAALELALQGRPVDIYEQDLAPMMRASLVNEGKIHQGFLYAKDSSERTARLVAQGGLAFSRCLSRWLDVTSKTLALSTPFVYAVHRDSMMDVDGLRRHFSDCVSFFAKLQDESRLRYLELDDPASVRELNEREIEQILDPEHFDAAFITSERAIDSRVLAKLLREAVLTEPRITFVGGSRVSGVKRRGDGRYCVTFNQGGMNEAGPYDQVVNALWEGRLLIDQSLGVIPNEPWIYRHKFGNRIAIPLNPGDLPSVTMVLGPFGDVVNFGPNGFYLSWYPIGMVETSFDLQPPGSWASLSEAVRHDVFVRSLQQWSRFCPKLHEIKFKRDAIDPSSGVIFAWGNTDIDDPASRLHSRYEIGIHSANGYHSVNTGKYTMVPYLGLKAAQRVMGLERTSLGELA